jgi:hypothetical protein
LRRIVPGLTTILGYHLWVVLSSEDGYGANLGGNAGFQPAVVPPRCGAPNRTVQGGARPKLGQPWANRPPTSSAVIDGLGKGLPASQSQSAHQPLPRSLYRRWAGWRRHAVPWHVCAPLIPKGRIHSHSHRRAICAARGGCSDYAAGLYRLKRS